MPRKPLNIGPLLRGVSRSFELSIRLLPGTLQEPVGLAYLLARITDTVADTTGVPAAQRLSLLHRIEDALAAPAVHTPLHAALHDFARHVPDAREKALLECGQDCLHALQQRPAADQAVMGQVLAAIVEGQRWDLVVPEGPDPGVQTRAQVDRYTWLVAGSVGEFWTRLCDLHLRSWHEASLSDLMAWGANYGKGLQRLNILRDAHSDLRAGRCYFPAEDLAPWDFDRARLCAAVRHGDRAELQRLAPLLEEWQRTTQELLNDGLRYSLALRGRRLRLASALPGLIGVRTLALLQRAGPQALLVHIKLPRPQVRRLLLEMVLGGVSRGQLQACWAAGCASAQATTVSARIDA